MAIAPGEARANIAKIDKIIFKNKTRENGTFGKIVVKRTTSMLFIRNNSIEIFGQKPRSVQS